MRRLGKKSKNASKCTKRWPDHEVEQLIHLLEENSCLWDVSNKDYYLRQKRERAYKQIEETLGTERAVIKAKKYDLTPTMLAVAAFVCKCQLNNSRCCEKNKHESWIGKCNQAWSVVCRHRVIVSAD